MMKFVLAATWILLMCSNESTARVVPRSLQEEPPAPESNARCALGFIGFCASNFPAPALPTIDHWLHTRTTTTDAGEEQDVPLISEWWWTTGVLKSEEGDEFGIEINSAGFYDDTSLSPVWPLSGFNQISVSDVASKKYFQTTAENSILPFDWATYDSNQPWAINHPGDSNGQGKVTMLQIGNWNENEPISIDVKTSFIDEVTKIVTTIDLTMTQREGKQPLYVNGDGLICSNPTLENPMDQYNFYYSLTYLDTYGTIEIGDKKHSVSGMMWQDHQYGFFSLELIKWVLQNLQLDNGVHLTNVFILDPVTSENPEANVTVKSQMTILDTNGESYCAESYATAKGDKIPKYGLLSCVRN
jgi:predicted secreted hydrolase